MKYIIVPLNVDQMEKIDPLMEAVKEAAISGKPGMCVAQVYKDHMVVGFLDHEKAKLFATTTETSSNAFNRPDYTG